MNVSEAIRSLQEPAHAVKTALISTGAGGGVTTATVMTSEDSFFERAYHIGVQHMFSGWDSQDTLTVIGFVITAYGLYLTRQSLALRRKELRLKFKDYEDG